MDDQVISRIGRYDVLAHIASGGMGTVYRAVDTTLNRNVALKVLSPDLAMKPHMLERFRREARSAAQLHHENIVAVFEFGEVNGTYFLAMEYVTGIDLHEYIVSRPKNQLDVDEARQILIQAARALDCAHRQGIVHRDIKPSNFLICGRGESFLVKLTDFGLARELNSDDFRLTRDNTTLGTVDYISPEQAQDSGAADIRSDLYSLGCTCYHMLAGHAPFPTGSLPERIMAHFQKEPPDLRHINPAVPDRLWEIVRKLLAKDPAARFQTPLELLRELESPDNFLAYLKQHPGIEQALGDSPTNRMRAYDPTVILERSLEETPLGQGLVLPDDIGLAPSHDDIDLKPAPSPMPADVPAATSAAPPRPSDGRSIAPQKSPPRNPSHAAGQRTTAARSAPLAPKKDAKPKTPDEIRTPPRDSAREIHRDKQHEAKSSAKRVDTHHGHAAHDEALRKAKPKRRPVPWPVLAGSAVMLLLLVGIVVWLSPRPAHVDPMPIDTPPEVPIPVAVKEKDKEQKPPVKPVPPPVTFTRVGPDRPNLISMSKSALAFDRIRARREYVGNFPDTLQPPENARTILVSRAPLAGKATLPTLADAWTAAAGAPSAIIEIADQGPHFVTVLPRLEKCRLLVRAAPGFRPLLLWDKPDAAAETHLAEIVHGELMLDNLDIGVRCRDVKAAAPASLFILRNSSLQAWECNLQQVGVAPRGIAVAFVDGTERGTAAAKIQFERCCLRGDDLQAIRVRNIPIDALFEGTLVAGSSHPLLEWTGPEVGYNSVRFVRSTLVTRSHLIAWSADRERAAMFPNLSGFAWDSILAHVTGMEGDLVHFDAVTSSAQLSWKVLNSAYLGWTRLLTAKDRQYATLEEWRGLRVDREGDIFSKESFEPFSPSTIDMPENAFQVSAVNLLLKASEGDGPIGVDFRRLPPEPYPWASRRLDWARHNYDGVDLPDIPFPDAGKPEIPSANPEVYSGEVIDLAQLDLARFDLAHHLHSQIRASKKRPERIVVHIKGKGTVRSSPLRFERMHVALYFDNLKTLNSSLDWIGLQLGTPEPMVQIDQGTLEIIGARMRLAAASLNSAQTPVVVRAVDSDLHLSNCRIDGPVGSSETFRALVQVQGPGTASLKQLTLKECILCGGASLVELKGQGIGVRAKHNLFIAAGDVFTLAPGSLVSPRPDVFLTLEFNTFAWKQSLLHLAGTMSEDSLPFHHPMLVQAAGNYHLSPFGGVAPILRGNSEFIQRDMLLWQGKNNIFDLNSLQSFDAPHPIAWPQLWGKAATQNSKWIDTTRGLATFHLDAPNYQLLTLPKNISLTPAPGANFKRLGLVLQ